MLSLNEHLWQNRQETSNEQTKWNEDEKMREREREKKKLSSLYINRNSYRQDFPMPSESNHK